MDMTNVSDDVITEVHALLLENEAVTIEDVAKELKMTKSNLYYRFANLELTPPVQVRTAKRNKKIMQMHEEGKSVREIRAKYKLSTPSIYAILRKEANGHDTKTDGEPPDGERTTCGDCSATEPV